MDRQGFVSRVRITAPSHEEAHDAFLARSLSGWTYKPIYRAGKAVAFCHPLKIVFNRRR